MFKAFGLCLTALLGLGNGVAVIAEERSDFTLSVSLRIDDRRSREIEDNIRGQFFAYLTRADGHRTPIVDIVAILASRGSFTDEGIDFPLWGDETELPPLLAAQQGRKVIKNSCDLSINTQMIGQHVFIAAFDPENVHEDDARLNLRPIELKDSPRCHRFHISDFCVSV